MKQKRYTKLQKIKPEKNTNKNKLSQLFTVRLT